MSDISHLDYNDTAARTIIAGTDDLRAARDHLTNQLATARLTEMRVASVRARLEMHIAQLDEHMEQLAEIAQVLTEPF